MPISSDSVGRPQGAGSAADAALLEHLEFHPSSPTISLAMPDAAWLIDEAVRSFGSVQGAALEACAGLVSAKAINSDPRAFREEEHVSQISRCGW